MDNGWYLLIACIVSVVIAIAVVYLLFAEVRDGILFRPTRTAIVEPSEPYVDQMVGQVHTRWFQRGYKDVLLFLHGNSGSLSNRNYVVDLTRLAGCDLVLMDYRGYGKSGGTPSLDNMKEDAIITFDRVADVYGSENVIVMSESIGSVSASYLVSVRTPRVLVMLCGLSSFGTIYREYKTKTAVMKIAAQLALSNIDRTPNMVMIAQSNCPILYVHSKGDNLVPYCCAEENHDATPPQHRRGIVTIGGDHTSPSFTRESLREIFSSMGLDPSRADGMDEWMKSMTTAERALDLYIVDM